MFRNQLNQAVESGFDGNFEDGPRSSALRRSRDVQRFASRDPFLDVVQPSPCGKGRLELLPRWRQKRALCCS